MLINSTKTKSLPISYPSLTPFFLFYLSCIYRSVINYPIQDSTPSIEHLFECRVLWIFNAKINKSTYMYHAFNFSVRTVANTCKLFPFSLFRALKTAHFSFITTKKPLRPPHGAFLPSPSTIRPSPPPTSPLPSPAGCQRGS
jgi:hypothetical protein